jgi:hypothetical protein
MHNISDGVTANAKHFTDCSFGVALRGKFPNPKDLFVGQLGHGMTCTSGAKRAVNPMVFSVQHILPMRSIAKIFKKAVGRDSVKMATLHTQRSFTNKSKKDKHVYHAEITSSFLKEGHRQIATSQMWPKNLIGSSPNYPLSTMAFPIGSHRSTVANVIGRKIWDGFKKFWGCGRILVSHGAALLHGVASGLEPYPCENRGTACSFIARPWVAVNG